MNCSREVSEFLYDTCQQLEKPDYGHFGPLEMQPHPADHPADESQTWVNLQVTGSTAEFRIAPMLPCTGDVDVMFYYSCEVAIPEGDPPPTWLPEEFDKQVKVYEIKDTEFPGYVFLVLSHLLRECSSDGSYSAIRYNIQQSPLSHSHYIRSTNIHGPASLQQVDVSAMLTGIETVLQADSVKCMHSLVWPPQAADWPTRYRKSGWPDSSTIDHVVSKGCDVVPVAHSQCKVEHQWRLSFSRAEVELINSWIPEQQIVYHMLRVFMKTVQLTDLASGRVSNYHIKTLMLWACELRPQSWRTSKSSLVAICAHLLRRFSIWLTTAHCQHYFVSKCNLFPPDRNNLDLQTAAAICQSMSEETLTQWFVDNYVTKCAKLCPDNTVLLFEDMQTKAQLQNAMSEIKRWKQRGVGLPHPMKEMWTFELMDATLSDGVSGRFNKATMLDIMGSFLVSVMEKQQCCSISSGFYHGMSTMASMSQRLAQRTTQRVPYFDVFNDLTHHFLQDTWDFYPESKKISRHNLFTNMKSLCSWKNSATCQDKAASVMKFLSSAPYGPEELEFITVAKFYLHKALKGKDAKNNGDYCLTNVYAAVLYHITGQYQTAIDHCSLVTRSQHHSTMCISQHSVVGGLLPKIDDNIDNALGLSVLYQYLRSAALNQREHETQHVGTFTTVLFAHYFTLKCLLHAKCFLAQVSLVRSTAMSMKFYVCQELELYRKHILESNRLPVSDLLLAKLPNACLCSGGRDMVHLSMLTDNPPKLSELTQLLRQNSVENLLSCPRFHEQNFDDLFLSYFEPLNLYRCCLYEKCLDTCKEIALKTINSSDLCVSLMSTTYCEFVQLMDTDLVSLMGLMILVNPDITHDFHTITISQLPLSLHLMIRCQLMLRHDVASLLQTLNLIDELLQKVTFRRIFDRAVLQLSRKQLRQRIEDEIDKSESSGTARYRRSVIQKPRPLRNQHPEPCTPTDVCRMIFGAVRPFRELVNRC